MLFTSTVYSNVVVYNSITNDKKDEKFDLVQPFTFLEYLNYSKSLTRDIVQFTDYQKYLEKWNILTEVSYVDSATQIKNQFVVFLKTITLNYTTNEEKRFLSNIDFNSSSDLEIAAPFYTNKIKEILLYFAEKRDTYKLDLLLVENKGTIDSIQSYLKTFVIETIFGDDNPTFNNLTVPLSTISTQIQIEVENGYDNFNDYFDLDPAKTPEFYNAIDARKKYFTANTNINDSTVFLDYNQAIINLINSEQVVLNDLQNLVVNINTPDLELLQDYDFIDYSSRTIDNVKLILNAELIKKFTGTDFYYLSTNNNNEVLSGGLFTATSPYSNLLNINNPATLTIPSTATVFERDVGLFFKPTKRGIIQLQTPFKYYIDPCVLKPNHVYIFPDPDSYGNVSGVSKVDHETPLTFKMQGEDIQKNISSNNALGNTFVTDNDFTFDSYHSNEQRTKAKSFAVTLYNKGVVNQYFSDVYGNTFIGFKQQNSNYLNNLADKINVNVSQVGLSSTSNILYLSSIENLLTGTLSGTQTLSSNIILPSSNPSIYNTRNSVGAFYIYKIGTDILSPLSSDFSDIFSKYTNQVTDLKNNLISIESYNDTFVFTTTAHTIIDKINYKDNNFYKSSSVPLILENKRNNITSNPFLINNMLYLITYNLDTLTVLSAYNSRVFNFNMYSYNINTNTTTRLYNRYNTNEQFSYTVDTKLDVYNATLVHNKKLDTFNIALNIKDTNKNFFLHNIQAEIKSGAYIILKDTIYHPNNVNVTVNFYDGSFTYDIITNTIVTTPTTSNTNGTITF